MKKLYKKVRSNPYYCEIEQVKLNLNYIGEYYPYNISYWISVDNLEKSDFLYDYPYLKNGYILNIGAWQEAKRLDIIGENND